MALLQDKWRLVELVLTLTATGMLMWFVRQYFLQSRFRNVVAVLSGIGLLCVLYLLGLPSAGLILLALVALLAIAVLLATFADL